MKKFGFIFSAALFALLCVSCNKELSTEDPVKGPEKPSVEKVHMSFTAGIGTKASVEEGESTVDIKWSADDHIAVWDGTEWCDFAATSVDGSSAVFEGEITPDETFAKTSFKAVYPFSAVTDRTSSAISVSVPAEQIVPAGGVVDPKALVSVATCSEEGLLSFEQVCALVKVGLTQAGMSAITLEGTGLAGTVVCADNGSVTSATAPAAKITLSAAEDGTLDAADYYIAVLPGTSAPLKVGMIRESDGYTGVRTATSVSFTQGSAKIYIKDSALNFEYNIYTPKQLKNWNDGRDVAFTGDVNILEDIDMSGIEWKAKDFKGAFNGNGKKLYNFTYEDDDNVAFISNLYGSIDNVIFGSSSGENYDGTSKLTLTNNSSDDVWRYAALIVRLCDNCSLSNVISYIPVEVSEESTVKTHVAGLIGIVNSKASNPTVSNCVNYGNVSNLATSSLISSSLAGIVSRLDAPASFSGVSNHGSIISDNKNVIYLGGIAADDEAGATYNGCSNDGDIIVRATSLSSGCSIAGIVGEACGSFSLNNCTNNGPIVSYANSETKVGGIVGRAYPETAGANCSITECTNNSGGTITMAVALPSQKIYVGGVIGNTPAGAVGTLLIQKCYNYADLEIDYPYTNVFGGIAGYLNGTTGGIKTTVKSCENFGSIICKAEAKVSPYVGGIVGDLNAKSGVGSSIESCINHGPVTINSAALTAYLGGVAGYTSYANIIGCKNLEEASVKCDNKYNTSNVLYIGGIFGRFIYGTVSGCTNEAFVFSNNTSGGANVTVNRIGGIGGTLHGVNSALSECTNSGKIEIDQSSALGTANNWQAAGGILGFQENVVSTVSNNTNTGAIDCKFNTTNANASAGGIIGRFGGTLTLSDNRNSGSVTAINVNTSTTAINCHAGGIIGSSNGGKTGSSVSGNVNTGAVSVGSTNTANSIGAGGLIGWAAVANSYGSGNKIFGSVSGINAGAVAGINAATITATLCDAVTVNGVAKADAADEATWLCPSNTGTITPTYVAHSDSE